LKKNILLLSIILLCFFSNAYAEVTPSALQKSMEKTLEAGQKSQKQADSWAGERTGILNKIREQKNMKLWLAHQQEKYKIYIKKQEKTISDLENRKKDVEKIKMNLEPFLDDIWVRLEKFIENDMPFLAEERKKRLTFLKDSLDDYHLDISEKTKRAFEALQVEAGYGTSIEKTEESIEINNRPVRVELFRLGRAAIFYLTPDKKQAGRFNRETDKWEPLPDMYVREIRRAVEIAEKKRTPLLLNLPVGRIQ